MTSKIVCEEGHFGFEDDLFYAKVDRAVALLRGLVGKDYEIEYSGGKDSDAVLELARRAGLDRRPVYHVTTWDPPELVRHVREVGAVMDHPGKCATKLVEKNGLPTRWRRWCCKELKHERSKARFQILGVRRDESVARRARWSEVVFCSSHTAVCPIAFWSEADVWRFLGECGRPTCCLYREGFRRIGCMGCCLVRGCRVRDYARWPRFGAAVRASFFRYPKATELYWEDWVHDRHGQGKDLACADELDLFEVGGE